MADLKFQPVRHDHEAFLEKASKCRGFNDAYDALELEYALAHEMLGGVAQALCRGGWDAHSRSN